MDFTQERSAFSQAMLVSLIPQILLNLHIVLSSGVQMDHHDTIAHYLLFLEYLLLFGGIGLE